MGGDGSRHEEGEAADRAPTPKSGPPELIRTGSGPAEEVPSGAYEVLVDSIPLPTAEEVQEETQIAQSSGSHSRSKGPRGITVSERSSGSIAGGEKSAEAKKRAESRAGEILAGRYRVERHIARGGMGRVYLATQLALDRAVAIKVLNPEFQKTDPQFVRRFCLEASILARLSHPNIVTVHDYGESDSGDLFLAMEYLDGEQISRRVARTGPFPADRLVHVALQICRALREAHAKGVIHRDLKPGNIMLIHSGDDPDFVKVLDFGLVKLFQKEGEETGLGRLDSNGDPDQVDLTRAGTLLGSPRYMSPEQIRGDALDPRTDIYSLGVILYQMATARPPFTGATSVDVIYKHMNHAVPPIHKQPGADDCPPALEQVILRCLEKNRDERYGSMGELVVALKEIQRAITGHPPGTESISIGPTSWSVRPPIPAGDTVPVPEPRAAAAIEEHRTARGRVDAGAREAAFRDDGIHDLSDDATPSVSQARSGTRGKRRSHAPFVMAALGSLTALIALAALVWVETRSAPPPAAQAPAAPPPARAPAPAPAPSPSPDPPPPQQQPATTEAAVSFDSVPTGAEVLENGALLGETPFVLKLPLSAPRMFVFRAPGHRDTAVLAGIDRPEVRVRGVLEPIPVKAKKTAKRTEEPETEDGPEEREDREDRDRKKKPNYYRDNPY